MNFPDNSSMPPNPAYPYPGEAGSSKPVTWEGMNQSTFAAKVVPYFGIALLVTGLGTSLGKGLSTGFLPVSGILCFVLYFVLMWKRHVPGLNVAILYTYAFVQGLFLAPLVGMASAAFPGIVTQALILTALSFFSVAGYVMVTGKDFSGLQPYLVSGLIVVIIAGIANWFVGGAGLGLGISILSVVLFMGFTAYDMSNIMHKFNGEEYILATVELYLDFINLFIAILRILLYSANSQSRR